ncbi:E3 ubiquitin-protein ligase TRIM71 [Holothuria leucospilota]|uniref:E3 ubiquitin-protein ligase TRIM71 n=1 Tax=Holothuria leucospilota TaxID=206669 RepID=A0A9Q0YIU4_HOLLE|nr:E3 ubiquitin-protein ligase TRIM71 [Holothuria leucospilota]
MTRSDDYPIIPSEKISDESYLQRVISSQLPHCDTHEQEKVRYYCTQCVQLACQVCATVNHQGHHSLQEVKSKVASVKAQMGTILEQSKSEAIKVQSKLDLTERTNEKIKHQTSFLMRKVNAQYEKVVTKLQCDRNKLLQELRVMESTNCENLRDVGENISQWLNLLENFQKMTRTILEQDKPQEILEMERNIVESFFRLRVDKETITKLPMPAGVYLHFIPAKLTALREACIPRGDERMKGKVGSHNEQKGATSGANSSEKFE